MRKFTHNPHTNPSLEYAALLSGLSMGGDFISDHDIKETRQVHTNNYGGKIGFTFVSSVTSAKR